MCSDFEAGSYVRRIHSCKIQFKSQGPQERERRHHADGAPQKKYHKSQKEISQESQQAYHTSWGPSLRLARLFFFITLKPSVECYTKSMSLTYEPTSEPLHVSVKLLLSNCLHRHYEDGALPAALEQGATKLHAKCLSHQGSTLNPKSSPLIP